MTSPGEQWTGSAFVNVVTADCPEPVYRKLASARWLSPDERVEYLGSVLVLIIFLITPASLPSQGSSPPVDSSVTLTGIVSGPDGQRLAGAEIVVDSVHRDISNATGQFSIRGLPPGQIELRARRVGYYPVTAIVEANAGLTVSLAINLTPSDAIALTTVVVKGKRIEKSLVKSGFYRRSQLGMGHYFGPDYFARHNADLVRVIHDVPSVQIERGRIPSALPVFRRGFATCQLALFVDGNRVYLGKGFGLEDAVNPNDLYAVEVYPRATEVPMEFVGRQNSSADCGVILVWTKPWPLQ